MFQKLSMMKDWIIGTYTQGGQPNLSGDIVKAIELRLPEPDEQIVIAGVLGDMDAEIAALEAKLAKARQVKQGMMQELLTGRIRLARAPSANPNGQSFQTRTFSKRYSLVRNCSALRGMNNEHSRKEREPECRMERVLAG